MSVAVGSHLQVNVGSWDDNPTSFTYEWQDSANGSTGWADATDLTGVGTASEFIVPSGESGKYLSCLVTGTNVAGSSSQQRSDVVGPVEAALTGKWGFFR